MYASCKRFLSVKNLQICKYTLHITVIFMRAYICMHACIFTLKHSLHSNPYPVTLTWHRFMGAHYCRLLASVQWTNSNRYILICTKIFDFHCSIERRTLWKRTTMRKESPSLANQWDVSFGEPQLKKIVVWKSAVLVSQISQTCWQAALCSSEAVGPHMNSSVRKAGHWENNCKGMVIRGYTAPLINMLAD